MRKQRLVILVVAGIALLVLCSSRGGAAPEDRTAPDAVAMHLEGGVIQAGGNEIKMFEVPVGPSGAREGYRYYDIECKLSMLPDGTVRVDRATAVPSARIAQSVQHFIAGRYQLATFGLAVSGPARSVGGREVWHTDYQNCAWSTGPTEGNPEIGALAIANPGALPAGYCFGHDERGHLIGAQSTATTLSIAWFRSNGDKAQPGYVIERSEVWKRVVPKE